MNPDQNRHLRERCLQQGSFPDDTVIAISTPEAIILRKVLNPKLIGVFIGVVTVGIIMVGYLFNIVL
jgi:hypothetical protein